ncbi:hypothetical protein [Pseudomonas extremaustralis]|uniref:hypothetical protein n=1 Tax=Pseudomonas extremaustralis TaxID=359110 RepID=UPI002AA7DDB0|nr:hypothetical protein [Pseudomonas extremaustralis]
MNDQELLKLAAKAVGCESSPHSIPSEGIFLRRDDWPVNTNGERPLIQWNPLTDNGAALRLAVELDIDVFQSTAHKEAQAGGAIPSTMFEPWGNDKLAATRRVIVRAAAEIGRAMP